MIFSFIFASFLNLAVSISGHAAGTGSSNSLLLSLLCCQFVFLIRGNISIIIVSVLHHLLARLEFCRQSYIQFCGEANVLVLFM